MAMRLLCFVLMSSALGMEQTCDSNGCGAAPEEEEDDNAFLQTKFEKSQDSLQISKNDSTTDSLTIVEGGPRSDLMLALPIVLMNLTNYSGLITMVQDGSYPGELEVTHVFGSTVSDEKLLFDMVHGFWTVLHENLQDDDGTTDAQTYCPWNNVSVIKRCVDMAMCMVQENLTSLTGFPNIEVYSLFAELESRFEEVSWNEVISSLQNEAPQDEEITDAYRVPRDYTCDGTFDWLDADDQEDEDNTSVGLLETETQKSRKSYQRAAAYRTSVALDEAAKITHAVLDTHTKNSSVETTLWRLYQAWEAPCKLLNCDHKNYYDLYGASHSHSLALIDAGASASHMRVHIRSRMRLEIRMQRFLGEHGVSFMEKMYSAEGTKTEARMQQYVKRGRNSFLDFVQKYASTQGVHDVWLDLLNRDRMKVFFDKQGQLDHFYALWDAHDEQNAEIADPDFLALIHADEELALAGRRRRRLLGRRRRRIIKAIVKTASKVGNGIANAANTVASAVNTAVTFLIETFACFGSAKTMVATGYCKKFGGPSTGAGVSFTASESVSLNSLLKGQFVPGLKVGIGAVFGAVPFDPVVGGLRSGVGISLGVACSQSGCNAGIGVGAAASALIPTNNNKCFVGSYLGDFKCMVGAGAVITAICCNFNLLTGQSSCR